MGATVALGYFVCPTCLHLRPLGAATEGHFPSRSVRAATRRVEVQCSDCNNGIGGTYEKAGADFIEFVRTVKLTRPDRTGSYVERRANVRNEGKGVSVKFFTSKQSRRRRSGCTRTRLDRMLAGSPEPRAMAVSIARPTDDVAKRALVAWSYLELFRYAGYRYAASPGAERVRQLVLDPRLPLPDGILFTKGSSTLPLAAPEPVLIVRREGDEIDEIVALGVQWDALVAVFPFANDDDDHAWSRVSELMAIDQLVTTYLARLRKAHPSLSGEINALLEVGDDSGNRWGVTADLTADEVAELAVGRSPRRMDPPRGRGWRPTMTVEHEFTVIEGDAPPLPNTRVDYWKLRFLAMRGGSMPGLIAELMSEIPGVPKPIPDPLPISMSRSLEGWRLTIAMKPAGLRASGVSPADAVAALLAIVEREFAVEA